MFGSMSLMHWLIVVVVVLLMFGKKGKIGDIMGDLGRGFGELKKGLQGQEEVRVELQKQGKEMQKELAPRE